MTNSTTRYHSRGKRFRFLTKISWIELNFFLNMENMIKAPIHVYMIVSLFLTIPKGLNVHTCFIYFVNSLNEHQVERNMIQNNAY